VIKLVLGIVVGTLGLRGWQEFQARKQNKARLEFLANQNKEQQ
jgi:predicted negative regulator of RcsB-dependent stress response